MKARDACTIRFATLVNSHGKGLMNQLFVSQSLHQVRVGPLPRCRSALRVGTLFRWSSRIALIAVVAGLCLNDAGAQENASSTFDGRSFSGWTTIDGDPVTEGWRIENGVISLDASSKPGHIITKRLFGDFDLSFEWKIAKGGNSGLKYRVRDYDGYPRGCEYQILDDAAYRSGVTPKTSAGALYGLYEPNQEKILKPPGEFNSARIVVRCGRVEHWLNGRLVLSAQIGSGEWKRRVAESKFGEYQDFSMHPCGRIMLTDHGHDVWFRDFEFRPLEKRESGSSR